MNEPVAALRVALRVAEGYLWVYAPEDILLQKLRRFRLGNEVSERQWRDVISIIDVQGTRLDLEYCRAGADELGVGDLFARALDVARPPE